MVRTFLQDEEWVAIDSEVPGLSGGGERPIDAVADLRAHIKAMRREQRGEHARPQAFVWGSIGGKKRVANENA